MPGIPGYTPRYYADPLRHVKNLVAERVDMGVDYSGAGPVYAIGNGVVTNANTSWSGAVGAPYPGYFISYKLTDGPHAGKYVYVAEDIWPTVKVGDKVTADTIIGNMQGGIETGWAAPPGTGNTMAAASGQASSSGDPGANATAFGADFSYLLKSLGAPAGIITGKIIGMLPKHWPGTSPNSPVQPGGTSGGSFGGSILSDIENFLGLGKAAQAASDIGNFFSDAVKLLDWIINPVNWVRIVSGIFGVFLLLGGIYFMSKSTKD